MSNPDPLDLVKAVPRVTRVGAIHYHEASDRLAPGYQGGLHVASERETAAIAAGRPGLAKAQVPVNLDGPDALAKAQGMAEGDLGEMAGELYAKEGGQLVKAKYLSLKKVNGKWQYMYAKPKGRSDERTAEAQIAAGQRRQKEGPYTPPKRGKVTPVDYDAPRTMA